MARAIANFPYAAGNGSIMATSNVPPHSVMVRFIVSRPSKRTLQPSSTAGMRASTYGQNELLMHLGSEPPRVKYMLATCRSLNDRNDPPGSTRGAHGGAWLSASSNQDPAPSRRSFPMYTKYTTYFGLNVARRLSAGTSVIFGSSFR